MDIHASQAGSASEGALDLDQLLQHRRFLQSLVRGMIADEQGVEDVLQETWIKALERPPGRLDSLRAWLARVARNAALNRLRGERRGAERDRRAARSELVETSGLDTAQKLERQQHVLAAVMRLREPRRTTIHMRYFEDREPAEIARVMNVSVNTVHDRLRRGRQELRRELERVLGQDVAARGLMGLYLLPLAGLPESATTALQAQLAATAAAGATGAAVTTTLAPKLLGGLLMSKKVLVAATIAVCAAGVYWTVRGSRPSPGEEQAQASVAAAPQAPERIAATEEEPEPVRATAEVAEETRAAIVAELTVTGFVRDAEETPRGEVDLRARLWKGYEALGEPDLEEELTSEANGSFAWMPPRPDGPFCVRVDPVDDAYHGYGDMAVVIADEAPAVLAVRVYPIDVSLTGFVRDPDGQPIAGATVKSYASTTTDEDGAYVLPASTHSPGMIYASAPGYAGKREIMEVSDDGAARLDFELRMEFRVFGHVMDESGDPVEGVAVTTFYTSGKGNVATTDAEGYYDLGALDPARQQHNLFGRKEGFVEASTTVTVTPDLVFEQDLVMKLGTRVEGRVVDENGEPIEGAELYIGFSPHAYDRLDAMADAQGHFFFPNVKSGKQTIGAHRDGYAPDLREFHLEEGTTHHDLGDIALFQGRKVTGWVFDPDGEPVQGVWIQARYKDDWIEGRAEANAEGWFELDALPPTDVELSFYKPGFVRQREPLPDGEVEELEIQLGRSGKVAGRVIDGITGEPITDFTIRMLQPECPQEDAHWGGMAATWVREGHSFSSDDGYWDTGDEILEPGTHVSVEATAPGYGAGTEPCVLIEEEPDRDALVIRLFEGRKVEGRVIDRVTGQPVAGAVIKRSRTKWVNPSEPHDVQLVRSDHNGEFTLNDVAPGRVSLLVQHSNWNKEFVDGPFEVTATGVTPYREILIGPGASLTGVVLDADGNPIPEAVVEIEGEARSWWATSARRRARTPRGASPSRISRTACTSCPRPAVRA